MEKMHRFGFTLSEVLLASSLSALLFFAMGFMWYFLTRVMTARGRLEELRQEIVLIMDNINKDVGYRAIGSRENLGLVICPNCPVNCSNSPYEIFAVNVDKDGNVKNGGEEWLRYYFNPTSHRLSKGTNYPGKLISDKVVNITVSPYPSGGCGDFFMIQVSLQCRYFPSRPKSEENPEVSVNFVAVAHQISVR